MTGPAGAAHVHSPYTLLAIVPSTNLSINVEQLDAASLNHYKVRLLAYGHPGLFSNRATIELPETGKLVAGACVVYV